MDQAQDILQLVVADAADDEGLQDLVLARGEAGEALLRPLRAAAGGRC